ncbi:MAG: phosphate ABC transporter permease PstA [Kiritimatiellae bacterium]|nr:phosphate ABC transporter permease PstA [Kiritimatiellia bacterium]
MQLKTRKILDRSFSWTGAIAIFLMTAALVILLAPMLARGWGAFHFAATIEHRRMILEQFGRGNRAEIEAERNASRLARAPLYRMIAEFEKQLEDGEEQERKKHAASLRNLKKALRGLLGPEPGAPKPILMRDRYGQTRWDRALVKLQNALHAEEWDYSNPDRGGVKILKKRAAEFAGTSLEPLFAYLEQNTKKMLLPRRTFYWRFLTDVSLDAHFFGGILAEILGTLYLAAGAMLFALPMGVMAAIYLTEYARESRLTGFLRTCINTLAGVPSIVFGLFGLAFFINTLKVSSSKSVLAGALTLALMILPTLIRASEEAIRSVPKTYKEAALSLGAGRGRVIASVILPAALPGILTGTVISMGRAAGETAPIIFTAAVSVGKPLALWQVFSQPTPALSWNIYNLATEHEAADEIRHVQYGLVLTLVALVLILNLAAIIMRARISRRLKG